MNTLPHYLAKDVEDIASLHVVPTMLSVLCQTTGLGFAAVARVTDDDWVLCSVYDTIDFGLKPLDQLDVKTTLCNELKVTAQPLVIDDVLTDSLYQNHITAKTYKFRAYVSVPIFRRDGRYFGSLFAIDRDPKKMNTEAVSGMLSLFAQLISVNLSTNEQIRLSEIQFNKDRAFINALEVKAEERTKELKQNNDALVRSNKELEAFAYISSHDLQEPLRKIQTLTSMITERESANLSPTGLDYFSRIKNAASRMQALIKDLLTYSQAEMAERSFKKTDLAEIINQVREDLTEDITQRNAVIEVGPMCTLLLIPFQFRQLLQNLFTNSLKFAKEGVQPKITVSCVHITENKPGQPLRVPYYEIEIKDNGIGFEQQYADKIFTLFQRLNDKKLYSGTGIGLAIVKKIVENHNGYITASGEPGEGAIFTIYLPENN